MPLTRRAILALASVSFLPRPVGAADFSATVAKVSGPATARLPDGRTVAVTVGLGLPAGASVGTGEGVLELALSDGTRLNAGRNTTVALAPKPATATGAQPSISVSGIAMVDRRGTGQAAPITVASDGFNVLLADSRVFLDSLEQPGVLVQDGTATVMLASQQIVLAAGEGVDIPPANYAEPVTPKVGRWSQERVAEAFASVGLAA